MDKNTKSYCFRKHRFLLKSDFLSSAFRNDHLKLNPKAQIYPMSILQIPHGPIVLGVCVWVCVWGGILIKGLGVMKALPL